jgi:hypothetical protein
MQFGEDKVGTFRIGTGMNVWRHAIDPHAFAASGSTRHGPVIVNEG